MAKDCYNCTEKCPQAELAHQVAVGRMYATKAFIELKNKVEKGELVEVVRCCDCKHCDVFQKEVDSVTILICMIHSFELVDPTDFCSYGERKDND